ncbi:hypothetical protein [Amycolatopsis sp. YIM 10]|uniref:hypothetical protein n=1 Tax=Amycolatopsis sp. YIM 10 TaxID=2653857 RepID=UPI0012901251|nr:hypothetical protein [Amycolatopsis sp. YIM 10]QFU87903.1 hypothetical protein YIM_13585 [Amycolatopsis sp. YIM 10]QFU94784.1 hypothetical protein YIM_48295 [Amycolatopsis sp. YIM 10]
MSPRTTNPFTPWRIVALLLAAPFGIVATAVLIALGENAWVLDLRWESDATGAPAAIWSPADTAEEGDHYCAELAASYPAAPELDAHVRWVRTTDWYRARCGAAG